MSEVHVFTSAAFNYIPKVRLLFQSIRRYHPEWTTHLALADDPAKDIDITTEPFDHLMRIDSLDIPQWRGWAFCHSLVELATAIKPFALARLLQEPAAVKAIYLDPDMVLFSRLDDILAALDGANILLTPHQNRPEESLSAVMDNEISSLKHGVYNLGFVGVAATNTGKQFANWWAQRCYHFCRADIRQGLFTDQRWIDLAPAFFDGVAVVRSTRHNVAPWNITTRVASGDRIEGILIDGEPLGFYHFTGFDSGAHSIMTGKNAAGNETVARLVRWYDEENRKAEKDPLATIPWGFGFFSTGQPISKAQRVVYRERVDLQRAFTDPFDADGYLKWWNSQGKLEYPALMREDGIDEALAQLFPHLSPGFMPEGRSFDAGRLLTLAKHVAKNPIEAKKIAARGWEVLSREGWAGVKRRFMS